MIKDRLEELRKTTGKNIKDFAKMLGLKYTTYYNYETGAREPDSDFLIMIANRFNVSVDWILCLKDDEHVNYSELEDHNIIQFEQVLDEAINYISNAGYSVSFSDDWNHDVIIKNSSNCFVAYFEDFELVGKYEKLKKTSSEINIYKLLENTHAYHDEFTSFERKLLSKFRLLTEKGQKEALHQISLLSRIQEFTNLMLPGTNVRLIAYYNKIAAAGHAIDSFSDLMQGTIKVLDTPESRKADFAIGVLGDSMEPTYYDGDILLVKKQMELSIGDTGIFQKDNGVYVKELGEKGLISHNPKYPPMIDESEVICIGKVLGKAELI